MDFRHLGYLMNYNIVMDSWQQIYHHKQGVEYQYEYNRGQGSKWAVESQSQSVI